ncbi:MAG: DNA topoisomerase I, partial [Pseudoflavonifractor sp.]
NNKDETKKCDFMTWDVPVKDDCPECGMTMFKKSGKGFKKPFCVNPDCKAFLPEDQRGYYKKKTTTEEGTETETEPAKKAPAKKAAAKKAPAKKAAPKKPAVKKPAAKKASAKENA